MTIYLRDGRQDLVVQKISGKYDCKMPRHLFKGKLFELALPPVGFDHMGVWCSVMHILKTYMNAECPFDSSFCSRFFLQIISNGNGLVLINFAGPIVSCCIDWQHATFSSTFCKDSAGTMANLLDFASLLRRIVLPYLFIYCRPESRQPTWMACLLLVQSRQKVLGGRRKEESLKPLTGKKDMKMP